jgi:hypothetical protein
MDRLFQTARRDDELLAWLSASADASRERCGSDLERPADNSASGESDDALVDSVDAVFRLVGSGSE